MPTFSSGAFEFLYKEEMEVFSFVYQSLDVCRWFLSLLVNCSLRFFLESRKKNSFITQFDDFFKNKIAEVSISFAFQRTRLRLQIKLCTVSPQWLKHGWLIYHG